MSKQLMERTEHKLITDGVWEHEQTLSSGKPFWVFFVCNVNVATWLIGVLIAGMGLGFSDAMFVLLLGAAIGSAIPATVSLLGPKLRLSQIEASRLSLGDQGKKLPALVNWVNCIGWDVIINILSASALVTLLSSFGIAAPLWLALAFLIGVQLIVGVYGHHMIQKTSRYTGAILGIFFILIGFIAIHKSGGVTPDGAGVSLKTLFSAIVLVAAYNLGFVFAVSDYTRYLPQQTPKGTIFIAVFASLFLSLLILGYFGYRTASVVIEQTPDGVMRALHELTGRFSPVVLLLIGLNSIPTNAVNDNSAAYSLMSAGVKLSRPVAATIGAVVGYIICLLASSSFIDNFENFLFILAHIMMPWAAILLVHWFVIHKSERRTPSGFTLGFAVFVGVSTLSILLFSANSLYTGFLSDAVGGVDIGPYIGFLLAGIIYYILFRLAPDRFKTARSSKSENDQARLRRRTDRAGKRA